ncbi:hypothetical protein BpHYR1_000525 [Brachionus plicatilis]|uniref:Uncharacterized protein n=1 Tax=Brachionus plicatilis TaxID=10195 RepID=A0A3M7R582_BRAPC|nr:hypothetical protein BpHYR1_000525 [Brachionus plicatilis]
MHALSIKEFQNVVASIHDLDFNLELLNKIKTASDFLIKKKIQSPDLDFDLDLLSNFDFFF